MDAQLITSLVALIVAGLAFYVVTTVRTQILEAVELVKHLVETKNAKTIGELVDAAETRRIDVIAPEDRTVAEAEHVRDVPMPEPEEGQR